VSTRQVSIGTVAEHVAMRRRYTLARGRRSEPVGTLYPTSDRYHAGGHWPLPGRWPRLSLSAGCQPSCCRVPDDPGDGKPTGSRSRDNGGDGCGASRAAHRRNRWRQRPRASYRRSGPRRPKCAQCSSERLAGRPADATDLPKGEPGCGPDCASTSRTRGEVGGGTLPTLTLFGKTPRAWATSS
jgi:hypothetical protein